MTMNKVRHSNRLVRETSPYLLQHAHNPVDWYPWGEEALDRAQREDKPILLSIGYSACHWCHVMEHESFEDEAVARVMNEHYVCIKVDREERPDLDKIYQFAHQILTQRAGGWPLNMFLTPHDRMPFFGGTYFPKTARHGMPAFTELLREVARAYRDKRAAIEEQNSSVRELLARLEPAGPAPGVHPHPDALDKACQELARQFDARHGGFGRAPKFPHPTSLDFLLRYWAHCQLTGQPKAEALAMLRTTLTAMANGGLYDQLGGGFCRYSVDERWEIPHFEKMLYDNAQLLALYTDAHVATRDPLFRRVAIETAEWVGREMQAPEGGYYSTLDADSEGEEGKFYVWSTAQIKDLLQPEEWACVERHFGLKGEPNFEGHWHLNVRMREAEIAQSLALAPEQIGVRLASAKAKLLAAREQRVRPGRDDKILTSWNGLMITGMARAGRLLARPDLVTSAERAFDFVRRVLAHDGRLHATTKDGKTHLNAYLDDYVFLIEAGLELLQARWRAEDLDFVQRLAETVLDEFEDESHGAFYFTGTTHEALVYRPKPTSDDAIPSGNGVAAYVLARLGHLLGDLHFLKAAERAVEALYTTIDQYPSAHGALLRALDEQLHPTETVVLRGRGADLTAWQERAQQNYAPRRLVVAVPVDSVTLSGLLAERKPMGGTTAYVCSGHACQAPLTNLTEFETALAASEVAAAAALN
jgi:uncharacterized protein YyaL (SSP411 family)